MEKVIKNSNRPGFKNALKSRRKSFDNNDNFNNFNDKKNIRNNPEILNKKNDNIIRRRSRSMSVCSYDEIIDKKNEFNSINLLENSPISIQNCGIQISDLLTLNSHPIDIMINKIIEYLFPNNMNPFSNERYHIDEIFSIKQVFYQSIKCDEKIECIVNDSIQRIINYVFNEKFIYNLVNGLLYERSIELSPRLQILIGLDNHVEGTYEVILHFLYEINCDFINNEDNYYSQKEEINECNSVVLIGLFNYFVKRTKKIIDSKKCNVFQDSYLTHQINSLLKQLFLYLKSNDIIEKSFSIFSDIIHDLCLFHPMIVPKILNKIIQYWPSVNTHKQFTYLELLMVILPIYGRPVTQLPEYQSSLKKVFTKLASVLNTPHVFFLINIIEMYY